MEQLIATSKAFYNSPTITALLSIIYALLMYLFSVEKPELILILFVLIFIDAITGMVASRAIGCPISSRRMSRSITKIIIYLSSLILANLTLRTGDCLCNGCDLSLISWIPTAVLLWISSIEVKSINENFRNLGYKLPAYIEQGINNVFDHQKIFKAAEKLLHKLNKK